MSVLTKIGSLFFLGAAALFHPTIAAAQISSSGPLADVNPWGVGWIGSRENALPADFWGDSRKQDLTPIFQSMSIDRLSPAELTMLTRVLLSSSKAPEGDSHEMIQQRVRLLKHIGEENKALDLYRRFPNAEWAESVDQIEVDQDLTRGNYARACQSVDAHEELEPYWLRARIVCLIIGEDIEGAELTAEIARSSGLDAPWFYSVISSYSDETDARPPANFDDGVNTALSLQAGLIAPINAFSMISPYRAAIIAQRPDANGSVRSMATMRAAIGGSLSTDAEREALLAPLVVEGMSLEEDGMPLPGDASEEDMEFFEENNIETPLQRAIRQFADTETSDYEKARLLDLALLSAQKDPRTFELHSRILSAELMALRINYDTITFAPNIVRSFISMGELDKAREWRSAMDEDLRPKPEPVVEEPVHSTPALDTVDGPMVLDPMLGADPVSSPDIIEASEQDMAPDESEIIPDELTIAAPEIGPAPEPELPEVVFDNHLKAELDAYLVLAGGISGDRQIQSIASALAASPMQNRASRLLYLMNGLGHAIPADARKTLAAHRRSNPRSASTISEAAMQMRIASDAEAIGEAMMHSIHVLRMDREGQRDAIAVSDALRMLLSIEQDDVARKAALEAAGLWDRAS